MTVEQKRDVLRYISNKAPRLIYHVFCEKLPTLDHAPKYCICGFCRDDFEEENSSKNFCCNMQHCITKTTEFMTLCLNSENIGAAMPIYAFYKALDDVEFKATKFRNQSFRNFVLFQMGKLGKNMRESPPACVKTAIRYKFPVLSGQKYKGYVEKKKKTE